MKIKINKELKINEKMDKVHQIKLHVLNNNKIALFVLFIINFLIQSYEVDNIIKITGIDKCLNLDGNNCKINNIYDCQFEEEGESIKLNFTSSFNSAKNMFKDCTNITSIDFSSFDSLNLKDTSGMFENCVSLKNIIFGDFKTSNIDNMSHMFYNCSSLTSLDLSKFQTSEVADMSYMFTNCSTLTELNLETFNFENVINMGHMFELCSNLGKIIFPNSPITPKLENMEYMFSGCIKLTEVDISKFDTTYVTTMESIFKNCESIESININNLKTDSLINMGSMFQSCTSLESIELSNFQTTLVEYMNDLFHDCINLKSIDLSNFFTENVIKMDSMFENCKSLTELNLKEFYTPSIREMSSIFSGCISVTSIDISNFDTFQIINFANIFYNCISLKEINIGHLVTNMASDMSYMFFNCSTLKILNLTYFNTERVLKMNSMFQGCSGLENLIISNFNNSKVMDMNHMFDGCNSLTSLDLSKFFTINVKNMNSLFARCSILNELDLSKFNTTNVLNMNSLFYGCSSLKSITIDSFDTSKVVDMSYMFYDCSSLITINLSKFDTSNVENFDSMFYNCKSFKSLSVSSFNTIKMESMSSMFHGCSFIEAIDLSHFKTENVIHMDDLFYGCSSLIRLDISNFKVNKVISMSYMFYGCKSLTSLNLPDLTKNLQVINTAYMFSGCSSLTSMDLSEFHTHSVINMDYMFSGCTYLRELKLNKWNTEKVESMNYMFSGCASLTSLEIISFNTPNLQSIKGMFYGCSSLISLDLSRFNTSLVTSMAYMLYKASSLEYINFYISESPLIYFRTDSVENMRYMFAFCTNLKRVDLSYAKTPNLLDMSFMFTNCENLIHVNLSNFTASKVVSMEQLFYKCLNLSFIDMFSFNDNDIINKNNLLNESLINMVFCIKPETNTEINKLINEKNSKSECSIIYCNEDYEKKRKKLIHGSMNKCVDTCENELEKYFYIFQCYKDTDCPNGTYPNEEFLECLPDSSRPPPCTIQNVVLGNGNCTLDEIEPKFNDTKISRSEFIGELIYRIKTGSEFALANYVLKYGMVRNKIFDEVYEITTLSDKNLYDNLTYINIQDCENLLKVKNHIDENEELILLKIEYPTDEFKIPIIEYKVFTQNKTELNISDCDCMKFVYSIPVEINETLEYKFNPDSEYNNELCYQFTTENNTDIILYDRRKEFNDANASLCESNCKFLNYFNKRAECECPVKSSFNKFLLEEGASRDNLIFRFKDNHEQMTNFGVLKCFKMLFTKAGFNSNFSSIIYITFILGNLAAGFYFCISDYKSLYSCIQSMAERLNKAQDKQILKNKNTKQNIITTGNNPPPKIKGENSDSKKQEKDLISVDSEKKNDNTSKFATKINTPSSLIDSKNLIKSGTDRQLSILNKENEDENIIILEKTDMEINMLSYYQAQKKDKRSCVDFYISFLKTRHIIISAFINDYNSFIVKVCFILFVFGISLCANTFFFTDKILHKYYINNGKETFSQSISDHVTSIIISTLIASIIKSAMLIFTFTDVVIIDIKEANTASREEKINQALIKVTSKSTLFFIINFVVMILCWLYVGSFCIVFTNTQMYLLVNGCISFCGVLILPFFYCLLTAAIRMIALNGKNKETLYKFSQFCELI